MLLSEQAKANYEILRECITDPIVQQSAILKRDDHGKSKEKRKKSSQGTGQSRLSSDDDVDADATDLADLIDV